MENICGLCKKEIADKTNSHILSHFLIKKAVNYKGDSGRDKELAYIISNKEVQTYLGDKTLMPHIVEDLLQKEEISFEEIDKIKEKQPETPFAKNYILCTDCEKRFEKIESLFEQEIYSKLKGEKEIKGGKFNLLIRVFLYSLIWRASFIKWQGFSLTLNQEEKLRKILDEALTKDNKTIIEKLKEYESVINSYPIILIYFETIDNTTENTIYIDKFSKMPYLFIINDIAFKFYLKESHIRSTPNDFFGLTDMINRKEYVNYKESSFKIAQINNAQRIRVIHNIFKFLGKELILHTEKKFYSMLKDKKIHPNDEFKNKFRNHIISEIRKSNLIEEQKIDADGIIKSFLKKITQ